MHNDYTVYLISRQALKEHYAALYSHKQAKPQPRRPIAAIGRVLIRIGYRLQQA